MSLKAFVEDIEAVDESIRSYYSETEGGYKLEVEAESGWALENIEGLKSSLQKERKLRSNYEKQVKDLSGKYSDVDLDAYREAMEKLEELSSFDPNKEAERLAAEKYEVSKKRLETTINKQWEAKFNAEHNPLVAKYTKIENQLREQMQRGSALQAIAAHEGDVDLLLPHVMSKIKFEMTDEGFSTELVDKGEPLYNNRGEPMSATEYVGTVLKSKFPAAFKSGAKSGGGKAPDSQSSKPEVSLGEMIGKLQPGQSLF